MRLVLFLVPARLSWTLNFLVRVVMMPEYPVCMVHKGLVPCTRIVVWFSGVWQSFVVGKVEEVQQVGKAVLGKHFPKP
jgi:hypothetical protein